MHGIQQQVLEPAVKVGVVPSALRLEVGVGSHRRAFVCARPRHPKAGHRPRIRCVIVVTVAAGAWLYSWVVLLGYAALVAYKNRFLIGIRAYPRDEHSKRSEQWLLLPLIAFWASVFGGLGTNLLLSSKWSIGVLFLAMTFMSLVLVSVYVGLVRRLPASPTWDSIVSLEALHAEMEFRDTESLSDLDISAVERRLGLFEQERASSYRPIYPKPSKPVAWRPRPRLCVGVVRDESGEPVALALRSIAAFAFLRSRLVQAATTYHVLTLIGLLAVRATDRTIALVISGLFVWLLLVLSIARGHIAYLWREESEHQELVQDIRQRLDEAKRRRSESSFRPSRGFKSLVREYLRRH
jgi:hypothetical protein